MTKSVSKIIRGGVSAKRPAGFFAAKFAVLAFAAFLFCLSSCDVGLGESVDTQAPAIEITYPPVSAVIRDSFILYGSWTDDKSVSKISVSVMNTETKEVVLSNVSAEIGSGSWQIELNNKDDSNENYYNGWQFADGTYQISVVATDNAGHTSGTVSRTFDIDNTPPVFVISNPGVVKKEGVSASAYGSIFTIDGTIADDHTISSMDVTIYDSDGKIVSKETYDGEEIESFHEDDISTAGGTSVTIAQYGENPDERYKAIYGNDKSKGTEYYTCSIKLTDSAQVYQSPTDSSSRSAEQVKADSTGNATYSLYLYDDVYTTLMSAKKGLGLSAADLKNILNKTVKNDDVLEILESKKTDTEGKDDSSNLYFSLNPQANPTYQVNGFEYSFADGTTLQQASSGNTVSVTITAGLDGTNIDPDGNDSQNSTVKVWLKEYDEQPKDSGKYKKDSVLAELSSLATYVAKLEDSETDFVEWANATTENPVTEYVVSESDSNSWKLIYDYGQQTAGSDESSTATKTFSVALPQNSVSLNKYYMIAVTGSDVEDVHFLQTTAYGFEGNEAGVAPTIKIESPSNSSLVASSDFSFTGTAVVKSSSLYVKKLTATLTVTDQNDNNKELATFSQTISSSADKVWSAESGSSLDVFSCDSSGNWTFTPSKLSGYSTIQAAEKSGESYLYTLEIYGAASSGHDTTVSSNVQIDSVLPKIEISSITPTVDEYDGKTGPFVNGTVTVKGTVEETNLESVAMQIYAGDELKETRDLGKVYSFTQTIDTTELPDEVLLDVKVTATDKVGNQTTYSSRSAADSEYTSLKISQKTDNPVITLNNASNSSETNSEKKTFDFVTDSSNINASNGNLFGTISNNKISVSVSDDDLIKSVAMKVYKADKTTIVDSTTKDDIGKSTYSNSFTLPSDEGVYAVEIIATDDVLSTELSGRTPVTATTGKFFIAVSAGAPTISLNSVKEYQSEKPEISGSVSSDEAKVSACFIDVATNAVLKTQPASVIVDTSAISSNKIWTSSLDKSLANGKYKILFTAENDYGESSTASAEFTVDDVAPTLAITQYGSNAPSGGVTSEVPFHVIPSNEYTIKGTATDGVSGVESVLFKLGELSEKEEPSTANGWNTASISSSGIWTAVVSSDMLSGLEKKDGSAAYVFHVVAVDNAGNKTGNSDFDYISIYPDSEQPVVGDLSATLGGGAISSFNIASLGNEGDFVISSNISDNGGIASVSIQNNNEEISSDKVSVSNFAGKYSFTMEKSVVQEGSNTFTVKAKDKAGNENSAKLTITSDKTAPNVVISGLSPTVTKENAEYVNGKITVMGVASDTMALAEKSLSIKILDSNSNEQTAENLIASGDYSLSGTYKSWNFVLDTTKLADNSSYTIKVSAEDAAGNVSSVAERTINVDQSTDSPVLTLSNADSSVTTFDAINNGEKNIFGVSSNNVLKGTITDDDGIKTVKITLTSENGTVTTEELLTGGTSTSYSLNYNLPSVEGGYTVEIFIEDTKGETSVSSISSSFALAVDSGAPSIKIETSNGGYYNGTSTPVNVEGTVSDGSGKVTLSAAYSNDGANSAGGNYSSEKEVTISDGNASISDTINISSLLDNTSGGYTATYTAKDRWGQTSSATFKYYKDSVSPIFDDENSSVAGTSTIEKVLDSWFKDETLSVTAAFTESGSGVDTVYFWLDPSGSVGSDVVSGDITKISASATASNSNGKATVKTSISGFTESSTAHTLEVVAVDKAGNKSATQSYAIRIDSTAPEFASAYYTFDGATFADASGSVLSNKKKDITVYGTVSDTASGVGEFDSVTVAGNKITNASFAFSTSELPASASESEISSLSFVSYSEISEKTEIKSWKLIIPASSIKDGSVALSPTDTAGNGKGSFQKIFTFEVDTTAPAVGFTSPSVSDRVALSSVNGTSVITGKITEAKTPKSLEFYYSTKKSYNLSDYTKLGETITDASAIYTWSKEFDFNALSDAENAVDSSGIYTGKASLYVLVAATDMAENANFEDGKIKDSDGFVEIPVDLNGDVPTVRITNLTAKSDGSYWLVNGEDAKIEGTLSDDDGSIAEFKIFETEITVDADENPTVAVAENAKLTWTKGESDFTYQPSTTTDGEKKLYFYIKDAAGGIFYTGKNTGKQFTEPKIQVRSGTALPSDNAFAYTSDGTAPKVSSVKIAYSEKENGTYSDFETFTAGTVLGGTEKRYAKFQIEASDDIGIESGTLTVGSSAGETLTFTNADENKIAAATSNVFDLASLLDGKLGYVNVSVVVKDQSGQSGNASSVFTLDNEGPATFNVTTPVLDTISTSDVTISGIAQDGSGSGIMSVEFAIPTAAQKSNAAIGDANEAGISSVSNYSDTAFAGDLKEGATAGLWSFVFSSSGDNGGQLTQYTDAYEKDNSAYALSKTGYIYSIPVWFKLTDNLGNVSVRQYEISYNPNANWPSATVTTPKTGTILGTSADFAGTATDNNNVAAVYIQFDLDGDGDFDADDKALFAEKNSKEKIYSASGLNFTAGGAISSSDSDWWGVKLSGTTSWNGSFTLPQTESESTSWQVRACAVDNENIAGLWSDGSATSSAGSNGVVKFRVDDDAPKIGLSTLYVSNDKGNRSYSSDMYVSKSVSENWYLNISLEDTDSGINIEKTTVTAKVSSGSTTTLSGWEHTKEGNAITYEKKEYFNYNIKIPLDLSTEGTVTYTVRTVDNSKAALSTSATYSFTVDNTAPTVNAVQFRGESLDMRKLYNTNYEAEISSVVQDDISGMASLNFFFERGGKYYVPFAGGSADSWKMVETSGKDFALTDGIPGVSVAGSGSAKSGTFEISDSSADISFIRAGGIIKIDGSYYNIKSVSGSTVTFDGTLAQDVTSAIFPYALSVNYTTTTTESSTWASGTYSVGNDDGDGLVETVAKSGAKWTCTASLLSDSIADGTVVLHAVAIDAAGNVSSDVTTRTMISNHTPRLAKVHLATDLNGDGSYSSDEIEEFSAFDDKGKTQEVVTLATDIYDLNSKIPANTNGKTDAKAYFKVTGDLVVAPEFVGGHEGQGSVYYDAVIGSKSEPTWNSTENLHGALADSDGKVADITAGITEDRKNVLKYLTLSASDMAGFNKEDNTGTIALSLWDSSEVYGFTGDENSGYKTDSGKIAEGIASKLDSADANKTLYSNFGYQWTVANIPVYFDITDDVAPTGTITPFYWNSLSDNSLYKNSKEKGHIEFEETPSVSGTVVFRGNATDDQLLKSLTFAFDNGKTATSVYTAATASWTSVGTLATEGYEFNVKNTMLAQSGHYVTWTLTVDSAKLLANGSNSLSVTAKQAKSATNNANNQSTAGIKQTLENAKTGYYSMNVVPYITGIERSGTTNRSRFGRYAVMQGESLTVKGFNFGTAGKVKVGEIEITGGYTCTEDSSAARGATSFTMKVPEKSGGLVVISGNASSLNNTNDNEGHGTAAEGTENSSRLNYYNREVTANKTLTTDYLDDRYLSVWALGNYFNGTDGGVELQKPVMAADGTGNLYASWVAQSNSNVMLSYGVNSSVTPIFRCYDQPATYTGIAYDKSTLKAGLNVTFIPEHQGSGGTFSGYAMSSSMIVGGAGAIQVTQKDIVGTNGNPTVYSGIQVKVEGNPLNSLDGTINAGNANKNATSYYNLANYDMNRRLGSFEAPHSARYNNLLHNIWYDNVTEGLKYSVVNVNDKKYTDDTAGGIVGWVVLDGGYTGQDRYYNYSTTAGSANNNLYTGAGNEHPSPSRGKTHVASYSDVIFASPSSAAEVGATSISFAATVKNPPVEGDTIALLNNTAGSYAITLKTITNVSTSGTTYTVYWNGGLTHTANGITLYQGNMNVVGGSATRNFNDFSPTNQSSSAGLSADIDVTSDGYPVVAYYDAENSALRVAYANSAEPKLASAWTRVDTDLSCSGEVSMRVDKNNGIHIMFKDSDGQLCYAYAASTADLGSMVAEVIDTNGSLSYGSISVKEDSSDIIPTVTYLNSANTANCIKYAYRTSAVGKDGEWDYQIIPSMGSGHYAVAENKISLESRKSGWTATDVLTNGGTAATPATVDSVIAFKSKRFETAYLKSEK